MDPKQIADFVEETINKNRIAVFSKSYCPYCSKAKSILSKYGVEETTIIELDQDKKNGSSIQGYLLEKTDQNTVPNIFIGQKHIGGCSDLTRLDDQNKLQALIEEASTA